MKRKKVDVKVEVKKDLDTLSCQQYSKAEARALKRKPFLRSNGKYLSRQEANDRYLEGEK